LNRCEADDHLEEGTSLSELRDEINDPQLEPTKNLRLWFGSDNELVAYAEFHGPIDQAAVDSHAAAFIWFKVLPTARGTGLEQQIIAWAQEQVDAASSKFGVHLSLEAVARDIETQRAGMLEEMGFAPTRYFLRMVRPLAGELPEPELPTGMRIVHAALNDAEYTELHNEVWVDHFGYQPWTAEIVSHYRSLDHHNPTLDLFALAEDGTPAAFCWCSIYPLENERHGRMDGWIGILGVRRAFRSQGVGRALLREGLRRLKAQGVEFARLGVDGASPTGATKLYESEGFQTTYSRILYTR
jgi:mycothiol synthase